MKRSIGNLTNWKDHEQKLLKNKYFVTAVKQVEHEYILAKSLIEVRRKKHLTQGELAQKIGSKQPVISRLETGAVKPTFSLLKRIATALDVELIVKFNI